MRQRIGIPTLASLAAITLVGAVTPAASADPQGSPNAETIQLQCGSDPFDVVVNGEGRWSPAHDLGSNSIFVPVWFGEIHGSVTTADGTVVDEFTEAPMSKGAGRNAVLQCTFWQSGTFEDPDLGELTFTVSGDVAGFQTPRS